VANVIWRKKYGIQNDAKYFSVSHENLLCYGKSKDIFSINALERGETQNNRYKNPDNDQRGVWKSADLSVGRETEKDRYEIITPSGRKVTPPKGRSWVVSEDKFFELVKDNRIWFGESGENVPSVKKFLTEVKQGITPTTFWDYDEVGHTDGSNKKLKELFEGNAYFDYPKPTELVSRTITIGSNPNELILDFFAGSGTTAHAIMELNKEDCGNRKYICVQLPELTDEKSEANKAGFNTIADISKERIRRSAKKVQEEINTEIKKLEVQIKKLQGELPTTETKEEIENVKNKIENLQSQDVGFKVLKLEDSNFKQWQQIEGKDTKALVEQMKLFVDPIAASATIENMVYELLLKSGKDLNSRIEKKDSFYKINDHELVLLLESATKEIMEAVIAEKPLKVIALDKLFKGNDQLKTNTVLQMRDAGVEFKTI
jgi:adenine-specific DNA-methyltransferase